LSTGIVSKSISQVIDRGMHINEFEFPQQTLFGKPLSNTVSNSKLLFERLNLKSSSIVVMNDLKGTN